MLTAISLSFIMGGFFSYLAASPFVFQVIYGFTLFEYSLTFAAIAIFLATIASQAGRFARRTSDLKVVFFAYTLMILAGLSVLIEAIVVPESLVCVCIIGNLLCDDGYFTKCWFLSLYEL